MARLGGAAVGLIALLATACSGWGDENSEALDDPRTYFEEHRDDLELVAEHVESSDRPRYDYRHRDLPDDLRYLSATEAILVMKDGSFFIPLWAGIPDDAGGFWHSLSSPQGNDMHGMGCDEPVRLDGDWWLCGVVDT